MANEKAIKIVIIDDDKSFCELLSFVLKKEGFDTKCYTDPQEALLNIVSDKPDLIILDLATSVLNGFAILEHLKKDLQEIHSKISIVTNLKYTDSGIPIDENYAKSLGVDGLIYKTDDLDEMVKKIKQVI
jgi:two-component system alkaline phosphatase synthesis response regulator PhoP